MKFTAGILVPPAAFAARLAEEVALLGVLKDKYYRMDRRHSLYFRPHTGKVCETANSAAGHNLEIKKPINERP